MATKAPLELVLVTFPQNRFSGEIVDALAGLVDEGTIKIIDILFVTKDSNGEFAYAELTDLADEDYRSFSPIVSDAAGFLTQEDMAQLGERMTNGSSAALMLFEGTWAGELAGAVERAGGNVIVSQRVPESIISKLGRA